MVFLSYYQTLLYEPSTFEYFFFLGNECGAHNGNT